ncbi:MAG TPA: malto-oligosyltrehalose trehalohydrolase [Chthoniobacteraceae bacterium]|nr:malto-oligosyltrehalose trehalohydrolase [Chthoniobacteraceae bacterium]
MCEFANGGTGDDARADMNAANNVARRFPIGAEVQPSGGTHFRVWAPKTVTLSVVWNAAGEAAQAVHVTPLQREEAGYFSGTVAQAGAGARYKFRLDSGDFPDPASRFQTDGVHGPSEIIDPTAFVWHDTDWRGLAPEGQVIYEMHIGTFTPEGTWEAARQQLPELAGLGITVIEVMPVADFPGAFGWGYDGVDLFAPTRVYGRPEELRAFVDAAHAAGIGIILDVVYNHFGPDGNYLPRFSDDYFSKTHASEWGDAPNFDADGCGPVREFVVTNAAYWIQEFHLDGLRLDATQQIFDDSPTHVLTEIARAARKSAGGSRTVYLVAENEPQDARLVRPESEHGYGLDALWNDDLHHSAHVALTGQTEAYYTDYAGAPQEFISGAKWGYLFQGQHYRWQNRRRGRPALDLNPWNFVNFLENHDQIANSLRGRRIHELANAALVRAVTTFLLLGPGTPMLFQGQEFAASAPFLYFADHHSPLAPMVRAGRKKFLGQFPSAFAALTDDLPPRPDREETFRCCKLDLRERETHAHVYRLHRDLLRLRREDVVFRGARKRRVDGAVLGGNAFLLRYFGEADDDRLLLVNLGRETSCDPAPEPLLAPPRDREWSMILSTEEVRYEGKGTPPVEREGAWRLPPHAAVVMRAAPCRELS